MESAAVRSQEAAVGGGVPSSGEKGLKKNAIGFVSSLVIGVASTAPGYSLAATLGFVVAVGRAAVAGDPADQPSSRCSWSPPATTT